MKIKPKEVLINLPTHFDFENEDELAQMAMNINSVLHGKSRVKYEIMGARGDKIVGLLYLDRNPEYHELREFIKDYIIDPDEIPILPTEPLEE